MITCTRRIQFCSGHRVMNHESKCRNMHGHNYVAYFTAEMDEPDTLDPLGRVIDFSVLKERLGGWIDTHWDHGFVFYSKDHEVERVLESLPGGQKRYALPMNPTAENMARYLLHIIAPEVLDGTGVRLIRVVLHETENCSAEVSL